MAVIIEDCDELEVTEAEAAALEREGLIYSCPTKDGGHFMNGSGCGFYHTCDDGFEKVDAFLKDIRKGITS